MAGSPSQVDEHCSVCDEAWVAESAKPTEEPPQVKEMLLLDLADFHCKQLPVPPANAFLDNSIRALANYLSKLILILETRWIPCSLQRRVWDDRFVI